MEVSAGGRLARGLAIALGCLVLPAGAEAAAGVTNLGTATTNVTIGAAANRSCLAHRSAGARGVDVRSFTARSDGAVRVRLAGGARDDWDLTVFRTSSGRRLAASQAWGGNEGGEAVVRKGGPPTIQTRRPRGTNARLPAQNTQGAGPPPPAGPAPPT